MEGDFYLNDDSVSLMSKQSQYVHNHHNLNNSNNYSVSMESVISKTELAKNQKKDIHQRIQSYASSSGNNINSNNKSKMNLFLSTVFRDNNDDNLNINISRDIRIHRLNKNPIPHSEVNLIEDDLIGKIIIYKIDDITLFKEMNQHNTLDYFYNIKGEMIQIQRNENAYEDKSVDMNNTYIKITYDRIEIALVYFNNENNKNILKLQPEVYNMLKYYAGFFPMFSQIGERILSGYEKVLKHVDIRSYIVYILEQKYHFDMNSNNKETLQQLIKQISISDLKSNIEKYIKFIVSEFHQRIVPFESFNSIHEMLNSLRIDTKKLSSFISNMPIIASFTLVRNIQEIHTYIESFFVLELDKSDSNVNVVNNYNEMIGNENWDKNMEEYKCFIEKVFYMLIIKINEYVKMSFPSCCGSYLNSKEMNYYKAPYIYCFDCDVIVCKKCFINHKLHNYFDVACTIRNKIGNIHSNKEIFLNYKHDDKIGIKNASKCSEDLIMSLILKHIIFDLDEYLKIEFSKSKNSNNVPKMFNNNEKGSNIFNIFTQSIVKSVIPTESEKVNVTIINILDILLFEFLFKTIYPLFYNEQFLTYELNIQSDSSREDSVVSILLMDILDSSNEQTNSLMKLYMHNISHMKEIHEQKDAKHLFECISVPKSEFDKDEYMIKEKEMFVEEHGRFYNNDKFVDVNESNLEEIEIGGESKRKFYNGNEFIQADGYIGDCVCDFKQVVDNYAKFKEKVEILNKGQEDKKRDLKNINEMRMLKKEIEMFNEYESEKKNNMELFINEKIKRYDNIEKTLNYKMKWFYLYDNKISKRSEIKYINGLGTLYSYTMNYLQNVLTSIANYGSFSNGIDKDEIITVTQDDFE